MTPAEWRSSRLRLCIRLASLLESNRRKCKASQPQCRRDRSALRREMLMSKGISRTVSLWLVFVSSHLLSMNALQSQEVHTSNGNLQIRSTKDGLEFMNARIKCHLTLVNGVYQQDFLALDRSNRWRLVASAFQTRGISPKSQDVSPLLRPGKSDERQFTANVLTRIDSLKQGQDSAVVILGGQSGNHYITEKIVLHSDTDFVDIEITDAVHDTIPPLFELLLSHFTFQPDGKKLSEYKRARLPLDTQSAPSRRPSHRGSCFSLSRRHLTA